MLRYGVCMLGKKTTMRDKARPFAAGAAVTAGAVVGLATAKALSDKKTRKRVVKELNSAKKQATRAVSSVVDKSDEMLAVVKSRAKKAMPTKEIQKTGKKTTTRKITASKKTSPKKTASR